MLLRTTRKLRSTEFGTGLNVDPARQVAAGRDGGRVSRRNSPGPAQRPAPGLRNPGDFAGVDVGCLLAVRRPLSRRHVDLDISARRVDPIGEGFDPAVRMATR